MFSHRAIPAVRFLFFPHIFRLRRKMCGKERASSTLPPAKKHTRIVQCEHIVPLPRCRRRNIAAPLMQCGKSVSSTLPPAKEISGSRDCVRPFVITFARSSGKEIIFYVAFFAFGEKCDIKTAYVPLCRRQNPFVLNDSIPRVMPDCSSVFHDALRLRHVSFGGILVPGLLFALYQAVSRWINLTR